MEKLRTWIGSLLMSAGVSIMPERLRSLYIMIFAEVEKGLKEHNNKLTEMNREYYRGNN